MQILECFNDQACSGDGRGAALAKLQAVAAVSFALHRFSVSSVPVLMRPQPTLPRKLNRHPGRYYLHSHPKAHPYLSCYPYLVYLTSMRAHACGFWRQAAAAANFSGDGVDVSAYLARTAALQSAYTAAQCGEGYTGPLCGKCAPGTAGRTAAGASSKRTWSSGWALPAGVGQCLVSS